MKSHTKETEASAKSTAQTTTGAGPDGLSIAPQKIQPAEDHSPFIQAKLTINQPNDPYEREADAVAAQVMRTIQRPNIQNKQEEEGKIKRKEASGPSITPLATNSQPGIPRPRQLKPTATTIKGRRQLSLCSGSGQDGAGFRYGFQPGAHP